MSQSKLDRSQRQQNIKGAFEVNRNACVDGMTVLLVDDVYTTGVTVDECCKVLKRSGANDIFVATTAIGKGIY